MKPTIVIHSHEINLKGGNRGWFEARLKQNLISILQGVDYDKIYRFSGRLLIELNRQSPIAEISRRLTTVFGVANFAFALAVPAELSAIKEALSFMVSEASFHTFKIEARRASKKFPLNSQQLNNELGAFVLKQSNASVKLENPEVTFFVEIAGERAFVYRSKIAGAGGLPIGTGGKVLCLLSGGIDSPVASFRLMRRGCKVAYIHFHSFPYTTIESQNKVRSIVRVLSRYQLESTLYLVPFADLQREIVAHAPPPMRVILYRRFMLRIAQAVAVNEKAAALVTGDSLGQVASQTLENIRTISTVTTLPIFRPLIGDDKEDIIRTARAIGTYDISIQADLDCCSLFVPKHPQTMASPEEAERAEAELDVQQLVQSALAAASRELIKADYFELG